jgi:hypothetical protein
MGSRQWGQVQLICCAQLAQPLRDLPIFDLAQTIESTPIDLFFRQLKFFSQEVVSNMSQSQTDFAIMQWPRDSLHLDIDVHCANH